MSQTNADRQRKWRAIHANRAADKRTFADKARTTRPVTMKVVWDLLYLYGHDQLFGIPATTIRNYFHIRTPKRKAQWDKLMDAIRANVPSPDGEDGAQAPIVCIGSGRKGDPVFLRISESWNTSRDWDAEQAALDNGEAF